MDIVILNYPTGEVDVIRGLDADVIETHYEGDIELYLSEQGYSVHDIHYMCTDELIVNEI